MSSQNNLTRLQQKELDELNWRIEFQNKVREHLRTNESIQNYFKDFTPKSVSDFIEYYSYQKANWHQHGELWIKVKEKHDLKWIEASWFHLELIQQKKLFDLQCLWRAEQIQLPGIELCCDFSYWEMNVLNCPFVEPITNEEVELYQEYLSTEDVQLEDDFELFSSPQSYDKIKEAYAAEKDDDDAETNFPLWYEFYNARKGTSFYLELPDTRGNKERYYLGLARTLEQQQAMADVRKAFTSKPGSYTDKEGRKILSSFSPESLDFFVEAFEDKQTRDYYKAFTWAHKDDEENERLHEEIKMLLSAKEPVAIYEHEDLKEAIHEAARRYTIRMISEHLPETYGQYLMNRSMNIAFPENNTEHVLAARKILVADILKGRKLNGEVEDLNF